MNHINEKLINDYLDGSLSHNEAEEMKIHLSSCEGCQSLFASYETIHKNLFKIGIYEAPESINSVVLSKILGRKKQSQSHKGFFITIFSSFGVLLSFVFWFIVADIISNQKIYAADSVYTNYKEYVINIWEKMPLTHLINFSNFTILALSLFVLSAGLFLIYERFQDLKRIA